MGKHCHLVSLLFVFQIFLLQSMIEMEGDRLTQLIVKGVEKAKNAGKLPSGLSQLNVLVDENKLSVLQVEDYLEEDISDLKQKLAKYFPNETLVILTIKQIDQLAQATKQLEDNKLWIYCVYLRLQDPVLLLGKFHVLAKIKEFIRFEENRSSMYSTTIEKSYASNNLDPHLQQSLLNLTLIEKQVFHISWSIPFIDKDDIQKIEFRQKINGLKQYDAIVDGVSFRLVEKNCYEQELYRQIRYLRSMLESLPQYMPRIYFYYCYWQVQMQLGLLTSPYNPALVQLDRPFSSRLIRKLIEFTIVIENQIVFNMYNLHWNGENIYLGEMQEQLDLHFGEFTQPPKILRLAFILWSMFEENDSQIEFLEQLEKHELRNQPLLHKLLEGQSLQQLLQWLDWT